MNKLYPIVGVPIAVAAIYFWGHSDGVAGRSASVIEGAVAAETEVESEWSPTKRNPAFDVYYPGTEALAPDEMRVVACGTGMPMPRLKQAAACFVIELGNGDKFIFDMGNGSF